MAQLTSLTVIQDNDATVDLTVTQEDGVTPQSLAGLTPEFLIKASRYAPDTSATVIDTTSGLTVVSSAGGTLTAAISHTLLASAGTTWFRLDLLDGAGDRTTVLYGTFVVVSV